MVEIREQTDIRATADEVFAVIVDLRGYDRWLTASKAFSGITDISSDPIVLGTTYAEPGPSGVRHGTVTGLQSPTRVAFHQPMTMKPRLLGIIDITVSFTLTPSATTVNVRRDVTLALPWPLKLVRPLVLRQFRTEAVRSLLALKAFAEGAR